MGKPIEILLVEDNPGDAELTMDCLDSAKVKVAIKWVKDGEEALRYLGNKEGDPAFKRPDLILLDLNLPNMHGREVLEQIKTDARLGTIPVVILTSSDAEADVLRSYELRANAYVTKPVDLTGFTVIVNAIEEFWLTVVKLPGR